MSKEKSYGGKKMGNIRTSFVKRISKELIERYEDKFSTDFDENKMTVEELSSVSTKHLRNKIAGYVTRLVRQKS
jgi:small subunit ribosomal protein S17e